MIECKDLAGKVIRAVTLFEEGAGGPELSIEFEDGSSFHVGLGFKTVLEAKLTRSEGGEPQVLRNYGTPANLL